jgi:hypothetical protein
MITSVDDVQISKAKYKVLYKVIFYRPISYLHILKTTKSRKGRQKIVFLNKPQ